MAKSEAEQVQELKRQLEEERALRQVERRGRTKAEEQLREVLKHLPVADTGDDADGQAHTDGFMSMVVDSVGVVKSCFKDRRGAPRQGSVVQDSRGYLQLHTHMQAASTLDGLEDFSHVWLIWVFHNNTNMAKQHVRAAKSRRTLCVKAKVRPPRLKKKIGLFSTRTPHRPNPVGLTLAHIERIDIEKRRVYLSGLDLVDGTPVIDIKPYIPYSDSVADAQVASWTLPPEAPPYQVLIDREVQEFVGSNAASLSFYKTEEEVVTALKQVLDHDIRSIYQQSIEQQPSAQAPTPDYEVRIDCFRFWYQVDAARDTVHVSRVEMSQENTSQGELPMTTDSVAGGLGE